MKVDRRGLCGASEKQCRFRTSGCVSCIGVWAGRKCRCMPEAGRRSHCRMRVVQVGCGTQAPFLRFGAGTRVVAVCRWKALAPLPLAGGSFWTARSGGMQHYECMTAMDPAWFDVWPVYKAFAFPELSLCGLPVAGCCSTRCKGGVITGVFLPVHVSWYSTHILISMCRRRSACSAATRRRHCAGNDPGFDAGRNRTRAPVCCAIQ